MKLKPNAYLTIRYRVGVEGETKEEIEDKAQSAFLKAVSNPGAVLRRSGHEIYYLPTSPHYTVSDSYCISSPIGVCEYNLPSSKCVHCYRYDPTRKEERQ